MKTNPINWNELWKQQMAASVEAMGGSDCARAWDNEGSARNYWQMVLNEQAWIQDLLDSFPIDENSRILDVGAGPGTLTIPLAPRVGYVTAVEPSGAMAGVLHENIKAHNLTNVDCVRKRWEEVDEQKDLSSSYDVVVASFSLGMPDIGLAIEKMLKVAKGYVFLIWFAGSPSWDRDSKYIFNTLFNMECPGMPQADIIFNILYQMGIYPHVDVFPGKMEHQFDSLDDMVADFCMKMPDLSETQVSELRNYYETVVEKKNGKVILPYTWQSMKLWWKTT